MEKYSLNLSAVIRLGLHFKTDFESDIISVVRQGF